MDEEKRAYEKSKEPVIGIEEFVEQPQSNIRV